MARVALMLLIFFCESGAAAQFLPSQIRKVPQRSELNCSWEEAQVQFSTRRELEILIRSVLEPHFRVGAENPARAPMMPTRLCDLQCQVHCDNSSLDGPGRSDNVAEYYLRLSNRREGANNGTSVATGGRIPCPGAPRTNL
jgi:hypothetical protein